LDADGAVKELERKVKERGPDMIPKEMSAIRTTEDDDDDDDNERKPLRKV